MQRQSRHKNQKLEVVSLAILRANATLVRKKMNVRQLAKAAGVSPAWIYKYMGRNRHEILLSAIDVMAPLITEIGAPLKVTHDPKKWTTRFFRSLNQTLLEVEKFPDMFRFYILSHLSSAPDAQRIQHHEDLYLQNRVLPQIRAAFGLSEARAQAFAQSLLQVRIGLIVRWLSENRRTSQKRRQVLRQIRSTLFDPLS